MRRFAGFGGAFGAGLRAAFRIGLRAALLASLPARPGFAAEETHAEAFTPSLAGGCATLGNALGLAVSGNYLLVAEDADGVQVVDIGDPARPFLTGGYDTAGWARARVARGDRAFVADGAGGLQLLDIRVPPAPGPLAQIGTRAFVHDVIPAGAELYLADDRDGLRIVRSEETIAILPLPGAAVAVSASWPLACATLYGMGIALAEVAPPERPRWISFVETPGEARDAILQNGWIHVADGAGGLQAIDARNPESPVLRGGCTTPGEALALAADGELICVAAGEAGLLIADASDPANPMVLSAVSLFGRARDVVIDGEHAFVACESGGVQAVRIRRARMPEEPDLHIPAGALRHVAAAAGSVFGADPLSGLVMAGIYRPGSLVHIDLPHRPLGILAHGPLLLVSDDGNGLVLFDISSPDTPRFIHRSPGLGGGAAIAADGPIILAAAAGSGLHVVELVADAGAGEESVPGSEAPQPGGTRPISGRLSASGSGYLATPGSILDIAISGRRAYLIDEEAGLVVVSLDDPARPRTIARHELEGPNLGGPGGIAVSGDYAFVACGTRGLLVFDVSAPSYPDPAGSCDTGGWARDVIVSGDLAFIVDELTGVVLADISNPTQPFLRDWTPLASGVAGCLSGNRLHVACGDGFRTLRVFEAGYEGRVRE